MIRSTIPFAGLALAAICTVSAASQTIQVNRDNKTIAITATDEATATADIAAVTVGFEIFGPDSDSTYANGARISQAILAALHQAGIDDKNIESIAQGIQRNTEFDDKDNADQRARKQFVFRQNWTVNAAPDSAAQVIRLAIAAGANTSGDIAWKLSDRKALQAKAAEAALVKARAIALDMADGMHVKLGDLIYASNQTPNVSRLFPLATRALQTESSIVASKVVMAAPPLEIRPQTIREEASVYAVFAVE